MNPDHRRDPLVGPHRHADRRPILMARNRIQAAIRAWLVRDGISSRSTRSRCDQPGNEAHLHAFATDGAIGNDGVGATAITCTPRPNSR
jgi:lysyl-tRNA synthetase class 2